MDAKVPLFEPDVGEGHLAASKPPKKSFSAAKVQEHQPRTEKALIAAIKTEFAKYPASLCRSLADFVPARLAAVIERNGGSIDY